MVERGEQTLVVRIEPGRRFLQRLQRGRLRIEGERGYGYRLIEDYSLPPQTFDRIEIEALTDEILAKR